MCINQGKLNLGMSNYQSLACFLDALLGTRITPELARKPYSVLFNIRYNSLF